MLKLRQAGDTFDPARLMRKFEEGRKFDWEDLRALVRRDARIDRERICADCARGFRFLAELSPEEQLLPNVRREGSGLSQPEQGLLRSLPQMAPRPICPRAHSGHTYLDLGSCRRYFRGRGALGAFLVFPFRLQSGLATILLVRTDSRLYGD